MAQIRTIDGERHNVKQTMQEVTERIGTIECMETGVLQLDMLVTISGWKKGEEIETRQYEPVCFIRSNVMMHY